MKLKVSDDAECPVETVFSMLTDFAWIEDDLRGQGVELARQGNWQQAEIGKAWTGRVTFRGKTRQIDAKVSGIEPGRMIEVEARIGGMRLVHETRLVPLGDQVTRVNISADMRPDTLNARLLIQSLKLARGRVLDRMQRRLASDIRRMERSVQA